MRHLADDARAWLDSLGPDESFFLYMHFMDVHAPYSAPRSDFEVLRESPTVGSEERLTDREVPYDAEALWQVAATTEEAERAAREVERGSRDYWLLRHLESLAPDTRLVAHITRPEERRTLIELEAYAYVTAVAPRPGHKPGKRLEVVIENVYPRAGRQVVREA